jgi:C4-dicarboxylate-specific signal transduction histidine kinase
MKNISTKLISTIIIVLIVVNTINIFVQSDIEKKKFIYLHEELMDRVVTRLKFNLPIPIWNLQTNVIEEIIATEALDNSIEEIMILDEENNAITSYISSSNQVFNTYERKSIIIYNKEVIGTVFLKYNRTKIDMMIAKMVKSMVLEALIIIFTLSVIIYFTINSLISKKLLLVTLNVQNFEKNRNLNENIKVISNDEIGYLSNEVNNMQKKLMDNRKELEEINNNLAKKVEKEVEKNREKEKQIFEQAKLAQMGEMIGNIAHQWRQPLNYISTTASTLRLESEMGLLKYGDVSNRSQSIVDKTMYLSQTIDTFRDFIKNDKNLQVLSVRKMIEETTNIIESTLDNENIKIEIFIRFESFYKGYKGELSQVLLNILSNSKDALIFNKTKNACINIILEETNNEIIIRVKDNAGGIPEDVLPKIFDPYFTTKHQSQGTGIGLYMSKDIVEKHHNGKLEAKNTEDGVVFSITLPKS